MSRSDKSFKWHITLAIVMSVALSFFVGLLVDKRSNSERVISARGEFLESLATSFASIFALELENHQRDIRLLARQYDLVNGDLASEAIRQRLTDTKSSRQFYTWIGVADTNGKVMADIDSLLTDNSVSESLWFKKGLHGNYVGDVHEEISLAQKPNVFNTTEPLRFIDFSSPIYDGEGRVRGVVGANISWVWADSVIKNILRRVGGTKGVEVFVISGSGQVLYPRGEISKEAVPSTPAVERFRGVIDWQEEKFVTAISSIDATVSEKLGWRIMVRQPVTTASAEGHEFDWQIVFAGLGILILSLIWAIYLARKLTQSITKRESSVREITTENNVILFPDTANLSDVDRLGDSLPAMQKELNTRLLIIQNQKQFIEVIFNATRSPMCVLDGNGDVLAVNKAWHEFRDEMLYTQQESLWCNVGRNYFNVCEEAANNGDANAALILEGISRVIHQKENVFSFVYLNQTPTKSRWLKLTVTPHVVASRNLVLFYEDITDFKEMNARLEQRELELTLAIEVSRLGTYHWVLQTNEHVWSKEFRKIFGIQDGVIASDKNFLNCLVPEDRQRVEAEHQQSIDHRHDYDCEYRIIWPDQSIRWIHACGRFQFDQQGRAIRMDGVVSDITDYKRSFADLLNYRDNLENIMRLRTKELTESELMKTQLASHLRLATEAFGLGVWRMDLSNSSISCNQQMLELFDFPEGSEPVAMDIDAWRSRIHPEDIHKTEEILKSSISNSTSFKYSFRIVLKNGEIRHIQSASAIEFDENAHPVFLIVVSLDVTVIKVLESQLRSSLADKDAILNSDIAGFWITKNQNIVWLNDVAASDLGYAPKDLIGQSRLILHSDHASHQQFQVAVRQSFDSGKTFHQQCILIHKNGSSRWFDIIAVPMPSDVESTIWVSVNIDALKRTEEVLQDSMKKAESANHAKSSFLATMSHEIRTPLNSVIGISYLLARTSLNDSQRRFVDAIETSSKNLLTVIDDILDFSKIEANELNLDVHEFSLRELLRDSKFIFGPLAENKGIDLEIPMPSEDIPDVLIGDAMRLQKILNNLLSNAIKFTSKGSILLSVSEVGSSELTVRKFRFVVKDSGIGIDQDVLGTLFQPFTQADISTARRYGGTGLGLSIVKRIAELMGGRVGADSQPGQGSTFWVEVALQVAKSIAIAGQVLKSARQIYVLIADDNSLDLKRIVKICEDFGWMVDGFENSAQLLDHVDKCLREGKQIDCVILDWEIPKLDGMQSLIKLRHHTEGVDLPAIIVAMEQDSGELNDRLDQMKPDSILQKPVNHSDLFNRVNEAVILKTNDFSHVFLGSSIRKSDLRWLSGVRVLVVDDSSINLDVMKLILTAQGAEPVICSSGQQATSLLLTEGELFDVVLMDLQMPDMDGFEAATRIRTKYPIGTLPIIALTASATITQHQAAIAAGMDDFLTKPVDPVVLIRLLRQTVEVRRAKALMLPSNDSTMIESDTRPNWPDIDGIDSASASKLFVGDSVFFKKCLMRFLEENANIILEIQTLINQADVKGAIDKLQNIREQAATIGALQLQHAAEKLESALVNEESNIESCISNFIDSASVFFG